MAEIWLIYSTFPDEEKAFLAARALLERRLVACASVAGGMTSFYRWEGRMQQEKEEIMLAKASQEAAEAAIAAIKALHPYEMPCIVAVPLAGGYGPFLQWVAAETADIKT